MTSWKSDKVGTRVRWTLEPSAQGTRLLLEQSGFTGVGGFILRGGSEKTRPTREFRREDQRDVTGRVTCG